jgi:hypothetical protein
MCAQNLCGSPISLAPFLAGATTAFGTDWDSRTEREQRASLISTHVGQSKKKPRHFLGLSLVEPGPGIVDYWVTGSKPSLTLITNCVRHLLVGTEGNRLTSHSGNSLENLGEYPPNYLEPPALNRSWSRDQMSGRYGL